jgi:hypothetical protein
MLCVNEHRAALFLEVPDAPFGNFVLPVGVDSTVRDPLVLLKETVFPRIVDESPIASMVVFDDGASLPRE